MSQQDVRNMEKSGETHRLSIALTIGATIGVIGLVLLLYGAFGTGAEYNRSDGFNINLWWGLVMLIVGAVMAGGSFLSNRRKSKS
ncbi:hypothetical protein [Ktedonobacter sp. SOSP1-52]|uniref:hypothetical protein n=1 Tax=Ktedonobacter sp. SOSP1-52 TaxID=2778366 RepID=UPI001916834B|nr:hypothetical protein [Ktedonobacter sp. SOSP1-52]